MTRERQRGKKIFPQQPSVYLCTRASSTWRDITRHIQALLCLSSQFSKMFRCLAPTPTSVSTQDFELLKRSQLSEGNGYETRLSSLLYVLFFLWP